MGDVTRADVDAIAAAAVERCPTSALSYTRTDGAAGEVVPELVTIRVATAGPLELRGHVRVVAESMDAAPRVLDPARTEGGRVALCRCGARNTRPTATTATARSTPAGWSVLASRRSSRRHSSDEAAAGAPDGAA